MKYFDITLAILNPLVFWITLFLELYHFLLIGFIGELFSANDLFGRKTVSFANIIHEKKYIFSVRETCKKNNKLNIIDYVFKEYFFIDETWNEKGADNITSLWHKGLTFFLAKSNNVLRIITSSYNFKTME